ncbi:unnamed protein product [Cyprideis torosa]|uniref:Uncharacterized protein n=1 Tax=Cyprideis torosa TaxID=163714 RepID=A0A7R8ZGC8_9CRUS|nr:unnamed protein product [Cyprideis torosa]CAG0881354.1 unnamed protein product [Cyprideis torosa]
MASGWSSSLMALWGLLLLLHHVAGASFLQLIVSDAPTSFSTDFERTLFGKDLSQSLGRGPSPRNTAAISKAVLSQEQDEGIIGPLEVTEGTVSMSPATDGKFSITNDPSSCDPGTHMRETFTVATSTQPKKKGQVQDLAIKAGNKESDAEWATTGFPSKIASRQKEGKGVKDEEAECHKTLPKGLYTVLGEQDDTTSSVPRTLNKFDARHKGKGSKDEEGECHKTPLKGLYTVVGEQDYTTPSVLDDPIQRELPYDALREHDCIIHQMSRLPLIAGIDGERSFSSMRDNEAQDKPNEYCFGSPRCKESQDCPTEKDRERNLVFKNTFGPQGDNGAKESERNSVMKGDFVPLEDREYQDSPNEARTSLRDSESQDNPAENDRTRKFVTKSTFASLTDKESQDSFTEASFASLKDTESQDFLTEAFFASLGNTKSQDSPTEASFASQRDSQSQDNSGSENDRTRNPLTSASPSSFREDSSQYDYLEDERVHFRRTRRELHEMSLIMAELLESDGRRGRSSNRPSFLYVLRGGRSKRKRSDNCNDSSALSLSLPKMDIDLNLPISTCSPTPSNEFTSFLRNMDDTLPRLMEERNCTTPKIATTLPANRSAESTPTSRTSSLSSSAHPTSIGCKVSHVLNSVMSMLGFGTDFSDDERFHKVYSAHTNILVPVNIRNQISSSGSDETISISISHLPRTNANDSLNPVKHNKDDVIGLEEQNTEMDSRTRKKRSCLNSLPYPPIRPILLSFRIPDMGNVVIEKVESHNGIKPGEEPFKPRTISQLLEAPPAYHKPKTTTTTMSMDRETNDIVGLTQIPAILMPTTLENLIKSLKIITKPTPPPSTISQKVKAILKSVQESDEQDSRKSAPADVCKSLVPEGDLLPIQKAKIVEHAENFIKMIVPRLEEGDRISLPFLQKLNIRSLEPSTVIDKLPESFGFSLTHVFNIFPGTMWLERNRAMREYMDLYVDFIKDVRLRDRKFCPNQDKVLSLLESSIALNRREIKAFDGAATKKDLMFWECPRNTWKNFCQNIMKEPLPKGPIRSSSLGTEAKELDKIVDTRSTDNVDDSMNFLQNVQTLINCQIFKASFIPKEEDRRTALNKFWQNLQETVSKYSINEQRSSRFVSPRGTKDPFFECLEKEIQKYERHGFIPPIATSLQRSTSQPKSLLLSNDVENGGILGLKYGNPFLHPDTNVEEQERHIQKAIQDLIRIVSLRSRRRDGYSKILPIGYSMPDADRMLQISESPDIPLLEFHHQHNLVQSRGNPDDDIPAVHQRLPALQRSDINRFFFIIKNIASSEENNPESLDKNRDASYPQEISNLESHIQQSLLNLVKKNPALVATALTSLLDTAVRSEMQETTRASNTEKAEELFAKRQSTLQDVDETDELDDIANGVGNDSPRNVWPLESRAVNLETGLWTGKKGNLQRKKRQAATPSLSPSEEATISDRTDTNTDPTHVQFLIPQSSEFEDILQSAPLEPSALDNFTVHGSDVPLSLNKKDTYNHLKSQKPMDMATKKQQLINLFKDIVNAIIPDPSQQQQAEFIRQSDPKHSKSTNISANYLSVVHARPIKHGISPKGSPYMVQKRPIPQRLLSAPFTAAKTGSLQFSRVPQKHFLPYRNAQCSATGYFMDLNKAFKESLPKGAHYFSFSVSSPPASNSIQLSTEKSSDGFRRFVPTRYYPNYIVPDSYHEAMFREAPVKPWTWYNTTTPAEANEGRELFEEQVDEGMEEDLLKARKKKSEESKKSRMKQSSKAALQKTKLPIKNAIENQKPRFKRSLKTIIESQTPERKKLLEVLSEEVLAGNTSSSSENQVFQQFLSPMQDKNQFAHEKVFEHMDKNGIKSLQMSNGNGILLENIPSFETQESLNRRLEAVTRARLALDAVRGLIAYADNYKKVNPAFRSSNKLHSLGKDLVKAILLAEEREEEGEKSASLKRELLQEVRKVLEELVALLIRNVSNSSKRRHSPERRREPGIHHKQTAAERELAVLDQILSTLNLSPDSKLVPPASAQGRSENTIFSSETAALAQLLQDPIAKDMVDLEAMKKLQAKNGSYPNEEMPAANTNRSTLPVLETRSLLLPGLRLRLRQVSTNDVSNSAEDKPLSTPQLFDIVRQRLSRSSKAPVIRKVQVKTTVEEITINGVPLSKNSTTLVQEGNLTQSDLRKIITDLAKTMDKRTETTEPESSTEGVVIETEEGKLLEDLLKNASTTEESAEPVSFSTESSTTNSSSTPSTDSTSSFPPTTTRSPPQYNRNAALAPQITAVDLPTAPDHNTMIDKPPTTTALTVSPSSTLPSPSSTSSSTSSTVNATGPIIAKEFIYFKDNMENDQLVNHSRHDLIAYANGMLKSLIEMPGVVLKRKVELLPPGHPANEGPHFTSDPDDTERHPDRSNVKSLLEEVEAGKVATLTVTWFPITSTALGTTPNSPSTTSEGSSTEKTADQWRPPTDIRGNTRA